MSDELTSNAARELSKLGARKGGKARANVLTPEERREIARNAVAVRWAKGKESSKDEHVSVAVDQSHKSARKKDVVENLPLALFNGKLTIGDTQFSVHVLNNGKRVMAQREVVRVLTGHAKGNLGRYIETERLQPYINPEEITQQTILFKIAGTGTRGIGYEATLLLDICDAYLRAREAGALSSNQADLAKQAEVITRACAKVGILALIDEATGYGPFKRKQEYQLKLQAFIADDLQEWARMFPQEFWFELARLEGVHYSPRSRPLRWGRYIMAFVYDTVDKDVGNRLREINPDPHFKQNHHQWLKEFGRQRVNDHLQRVIAVMKLCEDMEDFKKKFARVFQKTPLQTEFVWDVKT